MKPVPILLAAALTVGLTLAAPAAATAAPAASGSFSVLTYNVAGLPLGLSSGDPAANTPEIGRRISGYDVVHVQEDFNFHAALYANDTHPHRTPTSGGVPFGDGLNTLSAFPYSDLLRDDWNSCNGTDCLTPKGFSFSRIRLAEGVYVDFYNLHPNAGSADADLAARRANLSELSAFIGAYSAGNAVVVAGDTNTRWTRAGDNLRELVAAHGLRDAWVEEERGGVPPAIGTPGLVCDDAAVTDACEVVDKILFRGNRQIALDLERYANDDAAFRTADDRMLSDHYPITARLRWTSAPGLSLSDVVGGPHGTPFTDVAALPAAPRVGAVHLRSGSRVDQVGIDLVGGPALRHGGGGGTASSLVLAPGEHVRSVSATTVQVSGRTRIGGLTITTSTGRTLTGGRPSGTATTWTAPDGWQVAGFHGRAGSEVDKLGVVFTPLP